MPDEAPAAAVHRRRSPSPHRRLHRRAARTLSPWQRRLRRATHALLLFGAAGLFGCATFTPGGASRIVFDPSGAALRGPADAPVLIVEFADFRCPHCLRQQPALKRLIATYPGRVALAFVHVPVVAPDSGRAAIAAEAARRQGRFWEMHDALFLRMGRPLEEDDLRGVAAGLGIDPERFSGDLRDGALLDHVRADLASAKAIGIDATPSLLVNGRLLVGVQPYDRLQALVEEELRAAP